MDPNETLEQLREAVRDLDGDEPSDAADRVFDLFNALDEWLSKEGFLPGAWAIPGERG